MNTTKQSTRRIFITMFLILGVASVFSLVRPAAFAQDTYEERASFRTMNTAKIKNSEGIKNIDVGTFIENIWENTGIYQMIHTKTVAERAAEGGWDRLRLWRWVRQHRSALCSSRRAALAALGLHAPSG